MELRVLKYFLAIAREQSITAAAESLHVSQPTLSRQIKEMESDFGKQLFIRGNRKIVLTEEGFILRKRAEEILNLVQKTEDEIMLSDDIIAGDIYIGTGESEGVRLLIKAGQELQRDFPDIHIHMISGDSFDLMDHLDKGLFDFAVIWSPTDISDYESILLPYKDRITVLMPKDCSLAKKEQIFIKDLVGLPVITPRQQMANNTFRSCLLLDDYDLNVIATYNLIFNASLMVQEGMGYALGFDNIIDTTGDRNLISKPLYPIFELNMYLIWKKYQVFTKAAQLFLQKITENIDANI